MIFYKKRKEKNKFNNNQICKFSTLMKFQISILKMIILLLNIVSSGKEYGSFDSLDEAVVAKNIFVENDWEFSESIEMKFYNSYYWIFKVEDNVLFFIDKFDSYEDALDCLNSNKDILHLTKMKIRKYLVAILEK